MTTIQPPFAFCHSLSVCAVTAKIKNKPNIIPTDKYLICMELFISLSYIYVSNADNGFQRISPGHYLIDILMRAYFICFRTPASSSHLPSISYAPERAAFRKLGSPSGLARQGKGRQPSSGSITTHPWAYFCVRPPMDTGRADQVGQDQSGDALCPLQPPSSICLI